MHAVVHRAINLPDADGSPLSGLSDPYVRLQVGSTVASTSVADETLNPVREMLARMRELTLTDGARSERQHRRCDMDLLGRSQLDRCDMDPLNYNQQ